MVGVMVGIMVGIMVGLGCFGHVLRHSVFGIINCGHELALRTSA